MTHLIARQTPTLRLRLTTVLGFNKTEKLSAYINEQCDYLQCDTVCVFISLAVINGSFVCISVLHSVFACGYVCKTENARGT